MQFFNSLKLKSRLYVQEFKTAGMSTFMRSRVINSTDHIRYVFTHLQSKNKYFIVRGKKYPYFIHPYNWTWKNERTVEISYFLALLEKYQHTSLLEIGNVLSHYTPIKHDVLDKYEKAPGVINKDIVGFTSRKKYDVIFSISTLEHIGWDESPQVPMKIVPAIKNIVSLLKPDGVFIFSLPLGYNANIDSLLAQHRLPYDSCFYLKRISRSNLWEVATYKSVKNMSYNAPYPNCNALLIATITKSS